MFSLIFGIPLNLGIVYWSVILIACLGFIIMFGISSVLGDFQDLVSTTLDNDAKSRAVRKKLKKINVNRTFYFHAYLFNNVKLK
tara:strand:- start:199 stop:450 length:252 start_codon:yes stop_codon:yes gene_type:complete